MSKPRRHKHFTSCHNVEFIVFSRDVVSNVYYLTLSAFSIIPLIANLNRKQPIRGIYIPLSRPFFQVIPWIAF